MKRSILAFLAVSVFFLGLAMAGEAQAGSVYTQKHLTGKWNLSQTSSGRTLSGSVEFSKTGKLTKWVMAGVTQQALSGRLSVAADGKVTGRLTKSWAGSATGLTHHMVCSFNLLFISPAKVTGPVLVTLSETNTATGRRSGGIQRLLAKWTLTRLLRIPVRRPK